MSIIGNYFIVYLFTYLFVYKTDEGTFYVGSYSEFDNIRQQIKQKEQIIKT